ncbi:hypothetical protein OIE62_26230 [Streptomyces scopuliridis]|uniref:Uncharacterized protein n=1 Tax=Streptomyces scopuliridis TaxID=452529 RepID=A0ACD4ZI68_9ACTN|nr:hypothetical protein [Streptomyces scopuliridis]WSB98150.1 hypothetical protein OG835_14710 [Streptomyces scopuliridis]WSC08148.1 hypothetical protein OIE62_26230 [Streptomyces scopuliridis]
MNAVSDYLTVVALILVTATATVAALTRDPVRQALVLAIHGMNLSSAASRCAGTPTVSGRQTAGPAAREPRPDRGRSLGGAARRQRPGGASCADALPAGLDGELVRKERGTR